VETGPYWPLTSGELSGVGAEGPMTERPEAPEGVLVYFGVADIEAALRRVLNAGGTVVMPTTPIPTID
jgi:predicted enzyme related to lactoylglutathione lyase